MPLTNTSCINAKPKADGKPAKFADGGGMYLLENKTGKYWRLDYRHEGKRLTLALGVYPDVSLAKARERRDDARKLLADGIDPSTHKKAVKAAKVEANANTFEAVALEWFAKMQPDWAPSHAEKVITRLRNDIFPWIGKAAISGITPIQVLTTINRIETRGAKDTARRALQNCGQVFRYGVITGKVERDPTSDLRGALPARRQQHYAAITDPVEVGGLLRAVDAFKGTFVVQCALRLSPMFFVRPGELRRAEWAEFDLERGEWNIPAERMKGWVRKGITTPHLVPLAPQAVAILTELHALTGRYRFVFPGRDPKKPMSEAAVNAALRRMGYDTKTEMTGHGFRAMARTILHEELEFPSEVIEHQLAHAVPDALGTAYNRTKFVKQRREMMLRWAGYLDKLKAGAEVIALPRQVA